MEQLMRVLEGRSEDLTAHLVERQGLSPEDAERFVELAGAELAKSWRWQASALQVDDLPTSSNVRRLMGTVHAHSIATRLGIDPDAVWSALRTFVPRVLLLASGAESVPSKQDGAGGGRPSPRAPRGMEATS